MKEEEVIIGSSDGPTSVFVLGNAKKPGFIKRMKQKRYQKREDKIGRRIVPLPHTLDEVIQYMKERYDAQEIFEDSLKAFLKAMEMRTERANEISDEEFYEKRNYKENYGCCAIFCDRICSIKCEYVFWNYKERTGTSDCVSGYCSLVFMEGY